MAEKKPKDKLIGEVTHYFDKIGVAALKLKSALKVGDTIVFRNKAGEDLFEEEVKSIQIEHESVTKAKKGDEVGIKVAQKAHDGNEAYLVEK